MCSTVEAQDDPDSTEKRFTFPSQFSTIEFFDLLSQAAAKRFVASVEDGEVIKKLNSSYANRNFSLQEAMEKYLDLTNASGYVQGELIVIEAPFLGASPDEIKRDKLISTKLIDAVAAMNLISSLSEDQVSQMYLQGYVDATWLKPEQKTAYLKFVRPLGIFDQKEDEEILKSSFKFYFSYTASLSISKPDKTGTPWVGIYNYGTGLIWRPLAPPTDQSLLKTRSLDGFSPKVLLIADAKSLSSQSVVKFERTQVLSAQAALKLIEKSTGKDIVFDKRVTNEKLAEAKIVISQGNYTPEELIAAIPAAIGAELRPLGKVLFLGPGDSLGKNRRQTELVPQVKSAQQLLRRLPPPSSVTPFFPYFFDQRKTVAFKKLSKAQQIYVRSRLKNALSENISDATLEDSEVYFANTMWFTGVYGDIYKDPIQTTIVQLW